MKIKITSAEVRERNIHSKRLGKDFKFREQSALTDLPNGERRQVVVSLDDGQGAYPVGEYTVLDTSFYVDRNNKLALGRLHLAPVVSEAGRKSA